MNNIVDFDEIPKYRKKAKSIHHKKSDHSHAFEFCVYYYDYPQLDKIHGTTYKREQSIGTYCSKCGKVGARFTRDSRYVKRSEKFKNPFYLGYEWNSEALKEFDEETRTLPCFFLEDYMHTKYIDMEKK